MSALKNPLTNDTETTAILDVIEDIKDVVIDGHVFLSAEKRKKIKDKLKEIYESFTTISLLMKNTVCRYYEIGAILKEAEWEMTANKGAITNEKIALALDLDFAIVAKARKIFKKYEHCPELLENLTMEDAFKSVKKEALPEPEEKQKVEYMHPAQQDFSDVEESFAFPTLSGVHMNRYRIRFTDGKMYLLQKGYNGAVPLATIIVDQPKNPEMKMSYSEMEKEIQIAVEKYYAVVEKDWIEDDSNSSSSNRWS